MLKKKKWGSILLLLLVLSALLSFSQVGLNKNPQTARSTNQGTDTLAYAKELTYAGRLPAADSLLTYYIKLHPGNYNAYRLLASVKYWKKDFNTADSLYRHMLASFPDIAYTKIDYASFLFDFLKYEQAEVLLLDYLQFDKEHGEANIKLEQLSVLIVDSARQLAYQQKFTEAEQLLRAHLTRKPDNYNAYRLLATVAYWKGDFDKAETFYKKMLQDFPDVPYTRLDYGLFLFDVNRFLEAEKYLQAYLHFDKEHLQVAEKLSNIPDLVNEQARKLAYNKRFEEADKLLTEYVELHPDHYNSWRLKALVLYWMGRTQDAEEIYLRLLKDFSAIPYTQLDYGLFLFDQGKIEPAKQRLETYLQFDPMHTEANLKLAYISYWRGHFNKAIYYASLVVDKEPGHLEADAFLKKLKYYTATYINLKSSFFNDDQPLQSKAYTVSAGANLAALLKPELHLSHADFKAGKNDYNTTWLQAGNKAVFGKGTSTLLIKGGIFSAGKQEKLFTGTITFSQKLSKTITAEFGHELKPYQHTLLSLDNPFLFSTTAASLGYNKEDKMFGHAGYSRQNFPDGNQIHMFSGWVSLPLVQTGGFKLNTGYTFNYAGAEKNTFRPVTTSGPLRPDTQVQGIYDPYFTPIHQIVNSLLGSLQVNVSRYIELKGKGSYAFYGKAYNPNYIVRRNNKGVNALELEYGLINYSPLTLESELKVNLSRKASISGVYTYNSLLFYRSQQVSLQLKYLLYNERKKL